MKIKDLLSEKKSPSKPRDPNFKTLQAKRTSGAAGAHRDKKKEQKQGYEKHKQKVAEVYHPNNPFYEIQSQGQQAGMSGKPNNNPYGDPDDSKEAYFWNEGYEIGLQIRRQRQGVAEAGYFGSRRRDPDDWDEGNTEPPNNFAIYINGKKWKVFPGRGRYADDEKEMKQFYDLKAWCQRKSDATGKKWEVSRTGEAPTAESVAEKAPPGFKGTVKAMKKHKDIDNPFALAWSMKNKGYKSHKKADGSDK